MSDLQGCWVQLENRGDTGEQKYGRPIFLALLNLHYLDNENKQMETVKTGYSERFKVG